jgi:hypothetical protein
LESSPPNQDASDRVLGVFGKLSTKPGCFRSCSWGLWKALHQTRMLQIVFLGSLESSRLGGGGDGLGSMAFVGLVVQKFFEHRIISSLKIKLNKIVSENFGGIGTCLWWCCWKDLDEQDLMEFIWNSECEKNIDFELISAIEKFQINSKKSGFAKGKIS